MGVTGHRGDDLRIAAAIAHVASPLRTAAEPWDAVMDVIGNAPIVLLGEASHGTHEFYAARAAITRRLVVEKGFSTICIEGDWPHAHRVHRFLAGKTDDANAEAALRGFGRFPQWMWRNRDVVAMLDDLRRLDRPVSFHGLDLYSLHESIAEVVSTLERIDPELAARARERYACFDHFGDDPQAYGLIASGRASDRSCESAVVAQLVEMQRRLAQVDGNDDDAQFAAEMNARLVRSAEAYYRAMFTGRVDSWNLRDTHMAETLEEILAHLDRRGLPPKVVVWAHNSHLGDARATELGRSGELNLGQLVRERHGEAARLIGFTTYEGLVTAADDWDAPVQRKRVRPALEGSYEALFHHVGLERFCLDLRRLGEASGALREERLERAIGVIYRPETERYSHYFRARLVDQFDAVVHIDRTTAVEPLETTPRWTEGEPPETYPSAL